MTNCRLISIKNLAELAWGQSKLGERGEVVTRHA